MPYLRQWDDVLNLLGSRDADEIDDASREAHFDLTQRFDDIIQGGAVADPWVLKGVATTANYDLPHAAGIKSGNVSWGGTILEAINLDSATADGFISFPIIAPRGSRIKSFSMNGRRQDVAASLTINLNEINADTNIGSVIYSARIADGDVGPSIQGVVSDPIDVVLMAGRFYCFVVDVRGQPFNGAATLMGIGYTLQLPA